MKISFYSLFVVVMSLSLSGYCGNDEGASADSAFYYYWDVIGMESEPDNNNKFGDAMRLIDSFTVKCIQIDRNKNELSDSACKMIADNLEGVIDKYIECETPLISERKKNDFLPLRAEKFRKTAEALTMLQLKTISLTREEAQGFARLIGYLSQTSRYVTRYMKYARESEPTYSYKVEKVTECMDSVLSGIEKTFFQKDYNLKEFEQALAKLNAAIINWGDFLKIEALEKKIAANEHLCNEAFRNGMALSKESYPFFSPWFFGGMFFTPFTQIAAMFIEPNHKILDENLASEKDKIEKDCFAKGFRKKARRKRAASMWTGYGVLIGTLVTISVVYLSSTGAWSE